MVGRVSRAGASSAEQRNGDNLNGKNLTGTSVLVLPRLRLLTAGGHMSCLISAGPGSTTSPGCKDSQ